MSIYVNTRPGAKGSKKVTFQSSFLDEKSPTTLRDVLHQEPDLKRVERLCQAQQRLYQSG